MNKERLRQVRERVVKEYENGRFDYLVWGTATSVEYEENKITDGIFWGNGKPRSCGTLGCIAGHTVCMFSKEPIYTYLGACTDNYQQACVYTTAKKYLDLTTAQASYLFYPDSDYNDDYNTPEWLSKYTDDDELDLYEFIEDKPSIGYELALFKIDYLLENEHVFR